MQCPTPENLERPGGTGPKDRIVVGCGTCPVCLGNKRNDWTFRIHQELNSAKSACFITLTLEDEHLTWSEETGESTLNKRDLQTFHKKLRRSITRDLKGQEWPPYRFMACGEYGPHGTERPHYHIIAFNIPLITQENLLKIWGKGHITVTPITPGRIHYVSKYILNQPDDYDGRQKPFALMSRRPGLGNNYLSEKIQWNIDNQYFHVINQQGRKQNLPYYYRRVFTKQQISQRNARIEKDIDKSCTERRERLLAQGDNPAEIRQLIINDLHRKYHKSKKSGTL